MPLQAPRPQTNYPIAPEGTHVARCYELIQIGTIEEEYMGETREVSKVRLTFELPEELREFKPGEGEKPMVISQEYTLSMAPKANLRRIVEGMIGTALNDGEADAFDVETLVGMACLLTIKHKTAASSGKVRAEIASVSTLMKRQTAPDQVNPSRILTFGSWNEEVFNALPEFLKDKIRSSEEYKFKFSPSTLTEYDKETIRNAKKYAEEKQKQISDSEIPF